MAERTCPGLPSDWLNGWLAAIGAVVLCPDLRLRWNDEAVPLAALSADGDVDPAVLIAEAWPTADSLAAAPFARHLDGLSELTLNPTVEAWSERAGAARGDERSWMLSSLFTDLSWSHQARAQMIERGQLHTPMPGRDNTVHDRIRKLVGPVDPGDVGMSLDGFGRRIPSYGLGFDMTRIGSLADESTQLVDPVVEVLAFFGLALFPTRGDGVRRRQRGWRDATQRSGSFRWVTWTSALDADAIDALLDVVTADRSSHQRRTLGITSTWENVSYAARGTSDVTRGFGSRRVP